MGKTQTASDNLNLVILNSTPTFYFHLILEVILEFLLLKLWAKMAYTSQTLKVASDSEPTIGTPSPVTSFLLPPNSISSPNQVQHHHPFLEGYSGLPTDHPAPLQVIIDIIARVGFLIYRSNQKVADKVQSPQHAPHGPL